MKLLDRNEIEKSLDIKFLEKNLLITFHPVTLENDTAAKQMEELLRALRNLQDTFLIFTIPAKGLPFRIRDPALFGIRKALLATKKQPKP